MKSRFTGRVALFIAVLAGFLTPFDSSAVNIALPTIGTEFSMDAITLSWVATAYLLASAAFLVPTGRIADIVGRKKVFKIGLSVFTIASFLMIFSVSPEMIIALRVIQGIGSAMIFGTAVAILTSAVPPAERGKSLGIYITSVYLGLAAGPFLGGLLTGYLGWRSIFLINVPLGLLTLAMIHLMMKEEWADARGEHFDLAGSLLYGFSLVGVMYGLSLLPDAAGYIIAIAGAVLLAAFVWWEIHEKSPVLEMKLFIENRVFAFSNLAALINYSATFAVTFFMSLYLQYIRGLSPEYAGLVLIIQPITQAAISPFAGKLSDRIEPGIIASTGMALNAFGLFLLVFISDSTPFVLFAAVLAVLGLGFGLFSSPNLNAIMTSVEKKYYGIASGTQGTMRLIGQMLSMGMATMILAFFIGRVVITIDNHARFISGMHAAFALFTILCIVGVFFSMVRGKLRRDE
ncbi:major facilitator superfamily MFS_1 [Methanolacinia petrolearia DSM 11571]|uniref:Major facilitator superfamily MFS_1 n=1 Tax=Methanolacinia petrolearia (strain DSM 11571 / OCM 486 / SEBR 4847) TaxID=679926 RepID=E1RKH8_METP4|nr:MFS transporter [Methanolacinia petrolearia]ADN35831.1 major facilitator superfamily MFS_1 [Methanolacinia petrolearia DSM 11571]